MFTNLLFVILVMLLIAGSPHSNTHWIMPPWDAFWVGSALYVALLALILLQTRLLNRFLKKNRLLLLVNFEILFFLLCYYYLLGSTRLLESTTILGSSDALFLLYGFLLYFFALGVFHYSTWHNRKDRLTLVMKELFFIVPFILPFLFILFFFDILSISPDINQFLLSGSPTAGAILIIGTVIFLVALVIFMPYVIQKVWQCKPLSDTALKERLDALCKRANFKHAGLKTWTILNNVLTAAIVGVIASFRYVLFTPRLLSEMTPNEVEAILAHEIGHSKHKHLWLYPMIFLGLSLLLGILGSFAEPFINEWFKKDSIPSAFQDFLRTAMIFIMYGLIVAVFFRFVFGFFSRLFERQADLYIFAVGIPAQNLINAFDRIAVASGNIHKDPSWHHYSIQERIDFLQKMEKYPHLIAKHHRYVKWCLWGYFVLIALALVMSNE